LNLLLGFERGSAVGWFVKCAGVPILRQGDRLDGLLLLDDTFESVRIVPIRHDAEHHRYEVGGGLEEPVDIFDRPAVVSLGARGIGSKSSGIYRMQLIFWMRGQGEAKSRLR
jgi:hypothetical protein